MFLGPIRGSAPRTPHLEFTTIVALDLFQLEILLYMYIGNTALSGDVKIRGYTTVADIT